MQENKKIIGKTVNKSSMNANGIFEYKKLEYPDGGFIPCKINEEKETLEISYQVDDLYPYEQIHSFTRQDKLRLLLDVAQLVRYTGEYEFDICPENLYFDRNFKVYVMERDTFSEENKSDFSLQFKSLIGYTLQKKYKYADYKEGGIELLKKNRFLKPILEMNELEDIVDYLENEYETVTKDIQENKMLVNKDVFLHRRVYMILSTVLILAGCIYIAYYSLVERPQTAAKLQAEIDFLKGDYISVINDLSALQMEYLDYDQKYILSRAFVSTESLTVEQKENVLQDLPINGEEKLMEYWIYIGRLNPIEAQNIAMQQSDDELLLYAYMLEKDLTETDTKMTGEEKTAKLSELEAKIEKLAEKYMPKE